MENLNFPSTKELQSLLNKEKFKKIVIICGDKSFKNSGAETFIKNLLSSFDCEFFFKKSAYPDLKELKEIINFFKRSTPDLIIAIGGGSVLDYAKIANVLTDSKNIQEEITNATYNINKKYAKLIAIPTTAGSGAEVTTNAVIYIDKIKYSVEGENLKPDFFFLFPELVVVASKTIKASAGFDAIAQAIESLISKKSNEKSVKFAERSLQISFKYFLDFLNKPNQENTSAMCLSSNLAGEAISISKTTAPHAVSYPFTSIYNISHGHAVSLTLNQFLEFNYKNMSKANCNFDLSERYNIMFKASNTKNFFNFNKFMKNLKKKANLENDFDKLNINMEKDFQNFISGVNILRLSNNPVELKKEDLKNIILSK